MSTHPAPLGPAGPAGPGRDAAEAWLDTNGDRLPRLDEVVADARRYGEQMLAVLQRQVDPWSEPDIQAWPALDSPIRVHELLMAHAVTSLKHTLRELEKIAALPLNDAPAAAPVAAGDDPGGPPAPGVSNL